ncbi:MAG TPA: DCC1-like thiol-disulfide oxidoreductase family protein [Blastocatellia bacterium]|nr:DCC1-like thiol-disulfide oxidoreductase family protein [Blastocatellia bacterium]
MDQVLLYDGVCGFCNRMVQILLRHDRRRTLRFAALQSDYGEAVKARHPKLNNVDSVVLVEHAPDTDEERIFIRSDAALRIVAYLGGWWKLLLAFRILPRPVRDLFYDLFARYRYRLFGKYDSCLVPSPEVRARFLD